jgi:5-methylthioribose kinase
MNPERLAARAVVEFAAGLGLGKAEDIELSPISGGVSSDVWLARGPLGTACIKQALPTLRVAKRWDVPVRRGEFEARWLEIVSTIVPSSVPRMLGYEPRSYLIGMEYFVPADFPNWRSEMMAGKVDPLIAKSLGRLVGAIHAATADRPDIAARFDSDTLFDALRLDPYFRSLHPSHSDLSGRIDEIIQSTASTRRVLVHGDVSPKNVLAGKSGAILLDAECAWFGDPAFDVAFLCTHLLLKTLVLAENRAALDTCFSEYLTAYESQVSWEPLEQLWMRSAALLSAMLLARIDGKSPVDYLSDRDRNWVRVFARNMLRQSPQSPDKVRLAWRSAKGV